MSACKKTITMFFAISALFILILDSKTVLSGAKVGIALCIQSVAPSLLPFIFLSPMINASLANCRLPFVKQIATAVGIPDGAESALIIGFLGGYPIGAQNIINLYQSNTISLIQANRMLGFCNNAGPAFIFGILGIIIPSKTALLALWGVHIVSALLVGLLLPNKERKHSYANKMEILDKGFDMETTVKIISIICSWVIIFRIVIALFDKWFLWLLPSNLAVAISGVLELTNGCFALNAISKTGTVFVYASMFLAFGGICVAMQTYSVTKQIGFGMYITGKLLQTALSVALSVIIQYIVFSNENCCSMHESLLVLCISCICIFTILLRMKKSYSILPKSVV